MKVLIVTEAFTIGGLETHIRGEVEELLARGCEVHFAVGRKFNEAFLPSGIASISSHLNFDFSANREELFEVVDVLRGIIRDKSIDLVHIHPFLSVVPCLVAASVEGVRSILTFHGLGSFSGCYGPLHDFLLKSVVLDSVGGVVVVSPEVEDLVLPYISDKTKIRMLPNSVRTSNADSYEPVDPRWLVVSRIDDDKLKGIIEFIRVARTSDIVGVVVVGSGNSVGILRDTVADMGLGDFVEMRGESYCVDELISTFSGVAGMGRVVLEGVRLSRPVCLVGYDGVKGVVDRGLFELAKYANFSGRNLPNVSDDLFLLQKNKVDVPLLQELKEVVSREYGNDGVWGGFLAFAKEISLTTDNSLSATYRARNVLGKAEQNPYLESKSFLIGIGAWLFSRKYYSTYLDGAFQYCMRCMDSEKARREENAQMARLRNDLAAKEAHLRMIENSKTWRWTKAPRAIVGFLKVRILNAMAWKN